MNTYIIRQQGYFRIRVFGYGFMLINRKFYPPLFSVRNGYTKEYKAGKWGFQFLRKI